MYYARKIRLLVDAEAAAALDEQSRIANWLWNKLLERANELRQTFRETQDLQVGLALYSERGLRDLIPEMKKEHPFLTRVYSSPLKSVGMRLSKAIRRYQDAKHGQPKSPRVGWPRFHRWSSRWFSLHYEDPWMGYRLNGRTLRIHLGKSSDGKRIAIQSRLAVAFPRRRRAQVRQLTIAKEAGEYYAIFTLKREAPNPKTGASLRVIALDPNHKNLAYGVDTEGVAIEIENLATLRRLDERIDILKARRDRCGSKSDGVQVKGTRVASDRHKPCSRRWMYFNHRLEQAYQRRREETKKYLFTIANRLCRDYDVIAVGNYAPQGEGISKQMRRAMNNRSLIDRFKIVTGWVALRSGKRFVEYEEQGTTRTCHRCGQVVEGGINPKVRVWRCASCGIQHVRDENAALNGLTRVVSEMNLPCSGHMPISVTARWIWRVTPRGVIAFRRDVAVQGTS